MNPLDALRDADPADTLPTDGLDSRAEDLLQSIVAAVERRPRADPAPVGHHDRAFGRRPALVTAAVALLVAAAAVLAVRAAPPDRGSIAATGRPSDSKTALVANQLQAALDGRLIRTGARESELLHAPALVWTDGPLSPSGGPIETTGKNLFIAGACEGGGSLSIQISGRPDVQLECAHLTAVGPVDLTRIARSDSKHGTSVGVTVTSGAPRYTVKFIGVRADSTTTP